MIRRLLDESRAMADHGEPMDGYWADLWDECRRGWFNFRWERRRDRPETPGWVRTVRDGDGLRLIVG